VHCNAGTSDEARPKSSCLNTGKSGSRRLGLWWIMDGHKISLGGGDVYGERTMAWTMVECSL
jgi:hypothetical protein